MFAWLASLFALFLHGNPAQVPSTAPIHSADPGKYHVLSTSQTTNPNPDAPPVSNGGPMG